MAELKQLEYKILNVKVHALQPSSAVETIISWFEEGEKKFHYISSTNINNVVLAQESREFFEVMQNCDMSLPDGMPLLWYGRYLGYKLRMRCGIEEVMEEVFELSNHGYSFRHCFYGNTQKVLNDLNQALTRKYPKLNIVGMYSPPFRELTTEEDKLIIDQINQSNPDFIWVSLGCPKQETWLFNHRDQLNVTVGGGAGAVFNFMSRHSIKASRWIQYAGLEWLLRLLTEPKRLWRRYLIKYPKFFGLLLKKRLMALRWRERREQ